MGPVHVTGSWFKSVAFSLALGTFLEGLLLIVACTPAGRYRLLSTVFDGVPPPGSHPNPRRRPRRLVIREEPGPAVASEEAPDGIEAAVPEPPVALPPRYASYEEVVAAFPQDAMGNVNWVAAVQKGLIDPLPGIDPEAPKPPVLPWDVRLDPGIPQFEVVFPHAAHTFWLRCDNCHPEIFQMKAGADPITMSKIFQGEYCGRCHGKVAFPPETGCPRCHVKLGRPSG